MAAIDFPSSPTVGQTFTASGKEWEWDGTAWQLLNVTSRLHAVTHELGGTDEVELSPTQITGTAVIDSDARLTDSRTPTTHASTHAAAGSDPVSIAQSQVTNLTTDISAKANTASPTFTGTVTVPTLSLTTADTATTATHYMVETATDGVVRPKTLANTRTEIVTTAAVNSAAATTVGTVTSGTWQGSTISATYIDAAIARLASPTFTGTPSAPTAEQGTNTTQIATTAFVTTRTNEIQIELDDVEAIAILGF